MNQGTSTNFWSPGNDGVRVTVVDAQSGSAVSTPVDFSNRSQSATMLHFGKVSKIQYRDGASLSLQSGVPYNCLCCDCCDCPPTPDRPWPLGL